MDDKNVVHIQPRFMQRIDVSAAVKPKANNRRMWLSGVFAVWALVGAVGSMSTGQWELLPLFLATAALSGLMWWVSRRARRRVPETERWLEQLASEGRGSSS